MRKISQLAILALSAMMMVACAEKKEVPSPEREVEVEDPVTGIMSLRDINIEDTVTVEGRVYRYACTMHSVLLECHE